MTRARIIAVLAILGLAGLAILAPRVRRALLRDMVTWDATPGEPAPLPSGTGPGLAPAARTRVVLIDGLAATTAAAMPAWRALCTRGLALRVDVGFPTVSLPVEVALWTGLTQQQTGVVFRNNRPLAPPLDRRGIPAQVPGSVAVAEYYGYIVRSLGFARAEPAADPANAARDAEPEAWKAAWEARALDAVRGDAPLAFVHVLRVDSAGHKHGRASAEYERAAREADDVLARLVDAAPDARWFALSDHGHLASGGHGGEEREVRQVEGCLAGPGVAPGAGELVHVVDVARAIADSAGATLDPASRGRPLSAALATPLAADQAVPATALGAGAIAIFVLVGGLAAATWGVRRWWLAPWWFIAAGALLLVLRGEPTLSTPMTYRPDGRDLYLAWLPALPLAAAATWLGARAAPLARVVVAQLALPVAAAAAAITAAGGWAALIGAEHAPVVPRYSAYASPLLLMVSHGAAAVALGVLATLVRPPSDRSAPPAPPRDDPAAAP